MKTDIFQSCGHCWVFQLCWHIECSTFRASSLRIWNSLIGIPSPPLALFIVMLSKAHLTSHSRTSGSRWVIIPSWLSGSRKSFCTVFLCILATSSQYLLLLLGPYHFCPLFSPSLHKLLIPKLKKLYEEILVKSPFVTWIIIPTIIEDLNKNWNLIFVFIKFWLILIAMSTSKPSIIKV